MYASCSSRHRLQSLNTIFSPSNAGADTAQPRARRVSALCAEAAQLPMARIARALASPSSMSSARITLRASSCGATGSHSGRAYGLSNLNWRRFGSVQPLLRCDATLPAALRASACPPSLALAAPWVYVCTLSLGAQLPCSSSIALSCVNAQRPSCQAARAIPFLPATTLSAA